MPRFTIVVPHRGNALGLWATVQSIEESFRESSLTYDYVIVSNGEELSLESKNIVYNLEKSGKLLSHVHRDESLTPPTARQIGASVADGELLAFFDNHVVVAKDYFERVHLDFQRYDMDVLHSSTLFFTGTEINYHYRLRLEHNFWATSATFPMDTLRPYKIAAAGHGGFVVSRAAWDDLGGYGPNELFTGYGGEEMIFDLKAWRYGKTVWIDPRVIHYHWAGTRPYSRHYTDDYYTNLMVSAHVIGGQKWLDKVYESFASGRHIRINGCKLMYELMMDAYYKSAEYAKHVDANSKHSLDELLRKFRREVIAT